MFPLHVTERRHEAAGRRCQDQASHPARVAAATFRLQIIRLHWGRYTDGGARATDHPCREPYGRWCMPPQRRQRIYWKRGRAYADFRDFAKWGGKLEALRPRGSRYATTDTDEAVLLCAKRLDELSTTRRLHPDGISAQKSAETITAYVNYHMERLAARKRRGRKLTAKEQQGRKSRLLQAAKFFAIRGCVYLRDITVADVRAWLVALELEHPKPLRPRFGGRRGVPAESTRQKYLATLNGMLRRAWREGLIVENPIDRLDPDDRPSPGPSPTPFLEIGDASLLLEYARRQARNRRTTQNHVRIAVHLLTGGRGSEVAGLEKADIDLNGDFVWFRPNGTRANVNKSSGTARRVPLWSQLKEILLGYLAGPFVPTGKQLFDGGSCTTWMNRMADELGWPRKLVRLGVFRVTYASARVQTLDNGAPISIWTVQQEMGHATIEMLKDVYVRIGAIRRRGIEVAYPWNEYARDLDTRLVAAVLQHHSRLSDRKGKAARRP